MPALVASRTIPSPAPAALHQGPPTIYLLSMGSSCTPTPSLETGPTNHPFTYQALAGARWRARHSVC